MDIAKLLGGIDLDDVRKVAQLATQLPGMMSEFGYKLADAGGQARTQAPQRGASPRCRLRPEIAFRYAYS